MTVPAAEPIDLASIVLQDDPPPPEAEPEVPPAVVHKPEEDGYAFADSPPDPEPAPVAEEPPPPPSPRPKPLKKKPKPVDLASLPPLTSNDPPPWRRHLHWLLVLALVPLFVSLLSKSDDAPFIQRFIESAEQESPPERERILSRLDLDDSLDDQLSLLPRQRLRGAFLGRNSKAHWLIAGLTIVVYMAFFMFLASGGSAKPVQVLLVGLFTSTVGVGFLLLIQILAAVAGGGMIVRGGILTLILFVFKLIAFSYNAALDPENGFLLSFLGFTLGVGLLEEFVKSVALFWHRAAAEGRGWRGLFIWGLASGAGFGIAEGIMYSGNYYNGISGPGIYVVRFLSCVALHAIWSGSVAIFLYQKRDLFGAVDHWYEWIFPTLFVIAVPVLLHGLYDTCLKKEMNAVALLVAFASFGYLAFLFSRLQSVDDRIANKAMLREYERRKAMMT
ncbi:hypothetical protein FRUB_01773 [Fimbriiglobus ruber]|uniref:PrsW family intramembrane metalloprotease n=2 Tax=Fimbriiglobus ruber TaxID=1908690 RepID=A0A225DVP7_9BACT|nr:hypothetical protein FRUB_01773 [Fimbriiglobus ruber]